MNPGIATVVAASVGALASIFVNLIALWQQNKKRTIEEAVKDAKIESRLKSIEDKLETHNKYAEKMGSIEQNIAYIKGKLEKGA